MSGSATELTLEYRFESGVACGLACSLESVWE